MKIQLKMLQNLLICSLLFATIAADGQFSVLNVPKSIAFKGNEPLKSDYIDDVCNAALGYPTTGYAQWSGLIVRKPFDLPKEFVAVYVDGAKNLKFGDNAINYDVVGSDSSEALHRFEDDLKTAQPSTCFTDFTSGDEADALISSESITTDHKVLKPDSNPSDKRILQIVSYLNNLGDNFADQQCKNMIIRLSVADVIKTHGENSKATTESVKLISKAINNINAAAQKSTSSQALVAAIASESAPHSRVRRADDTANQTPKQQYNLADYYSENYPVIFNIILWFMVVFGLSLLAISYAIGSMDPGRDSIIYRMTSNRMKKDN